MFLKKLISLTAAILFGLAPGLFAPPAHAATPERVTVRGELIDTWCYTSEIMFALGTSHHKCAVWCAVGGIPVSILSEDETVYVILKVEEDDTSVANPRLVKIQTHEVTVEGDLYQRDGVNYLIVDQVADDHGIVTVNHEDFGIQPF